MTQDPTETLAISVISSSAGFKAHQIDDGSSNGMPDALGIDDLGRPSAIEVTRIGEEKRFEADRILDRGRMLQVPGGSWAWAAQVGAAIASRDFEQRLIKIAELCEELKAEPFPVDLDPALVERHLDQIRWYFSQQDLTLRRWEFGDPGTITLLHAGHGGVIPDTADGLVTWFGELVGEPAIDRKARKLEATGSPSQHLFLFIYPHGVPFGPYASLAFRDHTPRHDLATPLSVTDVWFCPSSYADAEKAILWWSDEAGWNRVSTCRT